jgi:hypothetical protein
LLGSLRSSAPSTRAEISSSRRILQRHSALLARGAERRSRQAVPAMVIANLACARSSRDMGPRVREPLGPLSIVRGVGGRQAVTSIACRTGWPIRPWRPTG